MNTISPYGTWQSPITSELIVSTTIGIGAVTVDGDDLYWLEIRPTEKGRNVLVRRTGEGIVEDLTPAPFNVRTRVHEYGGGAFLVGDGTVYFSNFVDGRIYYHTPGSEPQPLTAESNRRFADFVLDRQRNRLIGVCEDHFDSDREPENTIVTIDLVTGEVATLISGSDFYSSPRLSPDGTRLAWLSWNHPSMPWDSSYLWLAKINSEGIGEAKLIAGGDKESICEPKWSKDGTLYFASDRNNWWNLHRYLHNSTIEPVVEMAAEFAYPHWVFGLSTYDLVDSNLIICAYSQNGSWHLGKIDTQTKQFSPITTSYTEISSVQATAKGEVVLIAGSPNQPTAVVKFNPETEISEIIKTTGELELDTGYLSQPEAIAFPTENGLTAYAWYYPPKNKDYSARGVQAPPASGGDSPSPEEELPPLIVKSHGGPTASASVSLSLRIQYWTSRGFGYLDVNYGGSIGYGRQYRQRLNKNWGIVDIDDCVNAAKYLVQQGKVDGNRLVISGSSAGGYTTLAALTFRDTFKAGASYYGVSDLEILAQDTHKFESRYLDSLIGVYPAEKDLYLKRSPIYFTEQLATPVIFFQGLQDKVVPPNQAEMMFQAIKAKGLSTAYVTFEEEAHGFRQAENIRKALDSEFYFYARVFGFEPADALEPITIFNLIKD